jgi:hypothetical protein
MKRILLIAAVILLSALPTLAFSQEQESYASVAFLAGLGTTADRFGDGDIARFAVSFDYPATQSVSLAAKWEHDQIRWDDNWDAWNQSPETNVYSIGVRINLK